MVDSTGGELRSDVADEIREEGEEGEGEDAQSQVPAPEEVHCVRQKEKEEGCH